MEIELRIKATNNNNQRGEYDESPSFNLDVPDPVTAKKILNDSTTQDHITRYIDNNSIYDVDTRHKPTLETELSQEGEFYFSMKRSTTKQYFVVRVLT